MKVNSVLKKFSKDNDHRIVAFTVETLKGSTMEFSGCVLKEDAEKVCEMLTQIVKLTSKTEPATKRGKRNG